MGRNNWSTGSNGTGAVPVRGRRKTRRTVKDFYTVALKEAEQAALDDARELEGLDEEIAVLRVKLQTVLAEHPENFTMLLRGIELMVRAVSARYRISGKGEDDLYQSVVGVLKGIGTVLLPEGESHVR